MTSTTILKALASEFDAGQEKIQLVFEMLDAGLSAPFIGRFRREQTGDLHESIVRKLRKRRSELEELDRRRGTILRLLEKEEGLAPSVLDGIRECTDRFELEDRFIPHRRPEPEVQLAIDRGLGELADLLTKPVPKEERAPRPEKEAPAAAAPAEGTTPEAASSEEAKPEEAAAPEGAAAEAAPPEVAATESAATEAPQAEEAPAASSEETPAAPAADSAADAPAPTEAPAAPEAAKGENATPSAASGGDVGDRADKIELTAQLARLCAPFVSPDKGLHSETEALAGAMRILSDRLGRDAALRGHVRRIVRKHGVLTTRAAVEEGKAGRFKQLLRMKKPLPQLQGRNLLALRQAQKERILNTHIGVDPERVLSKVRAALGKHTAPAHEDVLRNVSRAALEQRLLPMVEADVRLELKERADAEALRFLSQHLRQILLTPPLGPHPVIGVDVSAKGDWTFAQLDEHGSLKGGEVTFQTGEKETAQLADEVRQAFEGHPARAMAIGHGKNSRSVVPKLREVLEAAQIDATVVTVSEAGLSSYANSELARKELADCSISMRMATSLGRRLQDPAAEILKVDPRHLGLGSEQGLVSKANIRRVFDETIESCAALVGCDVNRSPISVMQHLPGLSLEAAKKIVERRTEKPFESREELRESGILTEAQWTSAIAFLRVPGSTEPLDRTNLHPETYPIARRLLESAGTTPAEGLGRPGVTKGLRRADFDVDPHTWRDLMRELSQPGRDPRPRLWRPELLPVNTDKVRLTKDRVVEGIVSNVASFGAFVDIGLPADAMIHISEISSRYVRDARELLSIGQAVRARITDGSGQRLALSLKNVPDRERPARPARGGGGGGRGGRDRGGRDRDRGGRSGGRPEKKQNPFLRAAQSRRDGLAGASGGGGAGGGRGRGGPGGSRGGGPGRGGQKGGRPRRGEDEGAAADIARVAKGPEKSSAYNPFAAFFKEDDSSKKSDSK